MKVNEKCEYAYCVTVFLNGRKLDDCFQADDEGGSAWVSYRDVRGKLVPDFMAERGSTIYNGAQAMELKGKVEIVVAPRPGMTEEQVREALGASYVEHDLEVVM